jgi:hypothetical protein
MHGRTMSAVEFQKLSSEKQDLFIEELSSRERERFIAKLEHRQDYCLKQYQRLTNLINLLSKVAAARGIVLARRLD